MYGCDQKSVLDLVTQDLPGSSQLGLTHNYYPMVLVAIAAATGMGPSGFAPPSSSLPLWLATLQATCSGGRTTRMAQTLRWVPQSQEWKGLCHVLFVHFISCKLSAVEAGEPQGWHRPCSECFILSGVASAFSWLLAPLFAICLQRRQNHKDGTDPAVSLTFS